MFGLGERKQLSSVSTALLLAVGIGIIEALALYLGSGKFLDLMGVSLVSFHMYSGLYYKLIYQRPFPFPLYMHIRACICMLVHIYEDTRTTYVSICVCVCARMCVGMYVSMFKYA